MSYTYGKCPTCGKDGKSRERSPTGNTVCVDGHSHPSTEFDKFRDFTDFDSHIILYSKAGWYRHTDTLTDIKVLIRKIALLPDDCAVSDADAVSLVADTMHRVCAVNKSFNMGDMQKLYKEIWRDWSPNSFGKDKTAITPADMIESLLGVIRHKDISNYPKLPPPNPEYLTLATPEAVEKFNTMQTDYPDVLAKIKAKKY